MRTGTMLRLSAVLMGLFCLGHVAAQSTRPPPREEGDFVTYMAERLSHSSGARAEPAGRLSLRLSMPDGSEPLTANLDRVWAACERTRERCGAFVDEYVGGISSIVAERSQPAQREALRIIVRQKAYFESVKHDTGKGPLVRTFVGELRIALVVDGARSIRSARREDLQALKLSEDEAFEVAKHNLRTRELKPLGEVLKPISGKAIGYLNDNAYESSRLVLHEDWAKYAREVGNLVVAVPATNFLLYGSGASAEGIDALAALARDVARKNPRPLSPAVLRWTPRGWEVVR